MTIDREALKNRITGLKGRKVETTAAPQLYPTPPGIAALMVDYAEVEPGDRVLEPSAGTGNLLRALPEDCESIAVEIDRRLSGALTAHDYPWPHLQCTYVCKDFLELTPESAGTFHRVIMNPPFINGADIKHILHAQTFLKPGGRLVALCAAGPRQAAKLMPLSSHWEVLPAGSFKQTGTNVNVCLLIIDN